MNITIENQALTTQEDSRPKVVPQRMNFFEARHLLMLASRDTGNRKEFTQRPVNGPDQRQAFLTSNGVFEDALYWLISAPALGYLIYLVMGL
jgi:hypothetical protein